MPPAETNLEGDRASEDRDHGANAVEGMQPVHRGRSSIGIKHGDDGAENHVENARTESEPEDRETQAAIIRRQRHADQTENHDTVSSDRKAFRAPAI